MNIHFGKSKETFGCIDVHIGKPKWTAIHLNVHFGKPKWKLGQSNVHFGNPKWTLGQPKLTLVKNDVHFVNPKWTLVGNPSWTPRKLMFTLGFQSKHHFFPMFTLGWQSEHWIFWICLNVHFGFPKVTPLSYNGHFKFLKWTDGFMSTNFRIYTIPDACSQHHKSYHVSVMSIHMPQKHLNYSWIWKNPISRCFTCFLLFFSLYFCFVLNF
jgi:hypothetical protein